MAVVFLQEWSGGVPGTDNYDAVATRANIKDDPPDGLIVHTAGQGSDGAWRIIGVWESREQAERFIEDRLMPIINEFREQRSNMTPPETMEIYELHDFVRG